MGMYRGKMRRNVKVIGLFLFVFLFITAGSALSFAGWDKETKWKYYDEDRVAIKDQWIEEETGKRYYINEEGWMVTGWYQAKDGGQYFFDSNGAAVIGLAEIDERFYWFEKDGKVFLGDKNVSGKIYHFTSEGIVVQDKISMPHNAYTKEGRRIEKIEETMEEMDYHFESIPYLFLFLYGIFLVVQIRNQSEKNKREKQLQIVLSSASVLSISGLIRLYALFDEMFFNMTLCSVAVFLVSMKLTGRMIKDVKTDKKTAFASFFLAVLLVLAEVIGIGFRKFDNVQESCQVREILYMILYGLPLSCLAEPFFFGLFGMVGEGSYEESPKDVNAVFWKSWLAVFGGYIPCFLAFFPGVYGYDMSWQWKMYVDRNYNTHHPILHTVLSGWILETGNGIFGSYNGGLAVYALFQLLIFSGCIAFGLRFLHKIRISRKLRIIATGFYILFPLLPVLGISTTKDVIFAGLFLAVFVGICDMVNSRKLYQGWRMVVFFSFTILMGLFRNNGLYSLAVMAVCLLAGAMVGKRQGRRMHLNGKLAVLLLAAVMGIYGTLMMLQVGFHAKKGSVVEMMSIPFQQMARTYLCHRHELQKEDRELLLEYVPEYAMENYTYHISDPVKGAVNEKYLMDHKMDFINLWLRLGFQFPKEYILATMYNTFGIWYLGEDFSSYTVMEMGPPFDSTRIVKTHSLIPPLKSVYSWFTASNIKKKLPVLSMVFFTPFYVWTVLTCAVIVMVRKSYIYLIPPLYLLSYILTLALGPCMMMRYMLPVVVCVPILLPMVFFRMYEEIENESQIYHKVGCADGGNEFLDTF